MWGIVVHVWSSTFQADLGHAQLCCSCAMSIISYISYHYPDNVHSNHPCLFRWYIRCSDFIYLWKVSLFFLILCYKIQSVCVFVCLFGCLSVSMSIHNRLLNRWWGFYRWLNGSRVRSATKSYFSKTYLRYFLGKISPDV